MPRMARFIAAGRQGGDLMAVDRHAGDLAAVGLDELLALSERRAFRGQGRRAWQQLRGQNRKYRCAIGSTAAGSQVSSTPSARTS